MITPEKIERYRRQALAAIASRAHNPAAPGVSGVIVTPHDLLNLTDEYIERRRDEHDEAQRSADT